MTAKKETAEQKLLKLIENSDPQKTTAASQSASSNPAKAVPGGSPTTETSLPSTNDSAKDPGANVALKVAQSVQGAGLSAPNFLKNFSFGFGKKGLSGPSLAFGLREINLSLMLASATVAAILAFRLIAGFSLIHKKISFELDNRIARDGEVFTPTIPDANYYLDVVQSRNIFKPYEKKDNVLANMASGTKKIAGKTEKLKLRGISWFDSAESASVMIEDTETGVTHFLKQGEKVNDVTIKTIFADQVILGYEGEELSIHL